MRISDLQLNPRSMLRGIIVQVLNSHTSVSSNLRSSVSLQTTMTPRKRQKTGKVIGYSGYQVLEGLIIRLAAAQNGTTNGANGHLNKTAQDYTPAKQLDLNQDPDRLLFA